MTALGNSIEEYDVGEQLGKGGFAVVYRARCQNTGREVAVKKIDKGKIAAGGLINRVRQEVTIHSQLNHPAILKLYTFFEDQQYVYLILELCLNGELQKYIRSLRRVLTEDEAREYLVQIVSGMLYLHSHGIMHRDLTLSNLLLDNHGRIKIADFGLATQLKRPDDRHTTMCGTPNYISPEVATRSSHGLESDVWSLGCMLFIMLVGHPPFDGEGVKESIFTRVVIGDYKIPSYVSASARSLISECLQKNPRERIKLQTILQHPFVVVANKSDISRMSDSGMYTMSTATSNNNTRMPLTVISENNVSAYESMKESENYSVKQHTEPLRKHPASPPVRMKSSPRDLLPPNAGVIDSLKRKFTPLPSLKRGEDFAFVTPAVTAGIKRERDVSEERRRYQHMPSHKEGSSCEDRSDSSNYSSSHKSDGSAIVHTRGRMQRVESGKNLMQNDKAGGGNILGKYEQFGKGESYSGEMMTCSEYNPGNHFQETKDEHFKRYDLPRSSSVDRITGSSHQRQMDIDTKYGMNNNLRCEVSRQTQSIENLDQSGRYPSYDKKFPHRRSRSEDRHRESSYNCNRGSAEVGYSDSYRGRPRNHAQELFRDASVDLYRDHSLERHRDGLREPEHRSYREEPVESNGVMMHSCCQTLQHKSWCERRSNSVEKGNTMHSGCRLFSKGENETASTNKNVNSVDGSTVTSQRKECVNKILDDIPPVHYVQQPTSDLAQPSVASKGHQTPTKKLTNNMFQTIQQQVSPLCSKRLKATRQRTKNAILNIMDNGEICLEFLFGKGGKEKVVDVCRISPDGMRIVLYRPNGGSGSVPGDVPPPLPAEGADSIFSYENLPQKYWKKYIYASRFVNVVKAKTPKITYYSEQAKCMLMENSPDPDFEAIFYNGVKISCSGKDLTVKEANGISQTILHSSASNALSETLHATYLHFKEVRDHCLYLERVLTEVTEKTGLSCFPVIIGRKPPGMATPPTTARGNINSLEDKENQPVSMQSYRSPRNAADQIGSFQESIASTQSRGNCGLIVKQPFSSHPSSNSQVDTLTLKNPAPRVYVSDIGWATQGSNGVVSVEYLDGTHVLVSSNDPKVMFTDEFKVTKTFSTSSKLPVALQQKLSQMKIVLSSLAQPQRVMAAASPPIHRIGLR